MDAVNEASKDGVSREFDFSDEHFGFVQKFMSEETGISLADSKKSMVYGRLARRLRRCKLDNFEDYFFMVNHNMDERVAFINALTTNKTQFFREQHHFDYMLEHLIPEWQRAKSSKVRIWSAGCSTGEEPYTIASVLASRGMLGGRYDTKILATDLDTQVLDVARNGTYSVEAAKSIPSNIIKYGFVKGRGSKQELLKAKSLLRNAIAFKQLNLTAEWPHKGPFNAIFCRNVMIYFEKDTQQQLIRGFWEKLAHGGVLCIGHSESIGPMGDHFENLGKTMYRKP